MVWNNLPLFNGLVLALYVLSIPNAANGRFMDARKVPLSALTAPGNFYFLEFPVNEYDSQLNPICADGTPYSFAFRRGTDEHVSKLLIEFEGGSACWDDNIGSSCCDVAGSTGRRHVPWLDYMSFFKRQVLLEKTFPELGSCKGVPSGFVSEGAEFILADNNGINGFIDGDLPISLRRDEGWWDRLGGEGSDIRDWSYILLPHCTLDWHLGHKKHPQLIEGCSDDPSKVDAVYHRGGTNVDAVMNWIRKQFPAGLDALVTTAGGKVGGCDDDMDAATPSSIAPAIMASNLAKTKTKSSPSLPSTLVVTEGSKMWDPTLPSPEIMTDRWNTQDLPSGGGFPEAMQSLVESSTEDIQYIWMASYEGTASDEETLWFMKQANDHPQKFHVFEPTAPEAFLEGNQTKLDGNETIPEWCPLYTFPDYDVDVSDFFSDVINRMSWSSPSLPYTDTESTVPKVSSSLPDVEFDNSRSRLSFFSIFVMLGGFVLLAWGIYYVMKRDSAQKGKKAPLSPSDLWFIALTKYPVTFFIISLLIPITLSVVGFSNTTPSINMDFDSYLQVDTDLENVKRNFDVARENQEASLEIEQANCNLYGKNIFIRRLSEEDVGNRISEAAVPFIEDSIFGSQALLDELGLEFEIEQNIPFETLPRTHRELSLANLNYFSGGEWMSIMYQNREGGNVFEPDVLKAIHEFESSIYDFPGFQQYCYGLSSCVPIDSLISRFFRNGELVSNIESVLRSFLTDRPALWKLDQYFGPENLASNVTRSFVFLRNVGGDQSATHPWLRSFYRDFLAKHDRKRTYPEFVHTWNNFIMKTTEADDALFHDSLWAIGSLVFVALMILYKVRSLFVVFFSMLGMVLAFSVSYYWLSVHFFVKDITLIWIAGLFVMLGIAADDIFLMVDSFDHTKHEFDEELSNRMTEINSGDSDPDDEKLRDAKLQILRKRIIVAYHKAGSMMLVSSVTTSICFFSNGFGVLTVIQEFGIFMGMVVLVNYLHVMTILPSSILVNEIYVASEEKRFLTWCKSLFIANKLGNEQRDAQCADYNHVDDTDTEKCLENYVNGGKEESKGIIGKTSNLDPAERYLIETYAPFVNKRAYYILVSTVILAIILGICGAINFAVNDGSIVLYSPKYNLGRLEKLVNSYYSESEDVYTTIEKDTAPATFPPNPAPTPVPAPTTPMPTKSSGTSVITAVGFSSPEEAAETYPDDHTVVEPSDLGTEPPESLEGSSANQGSNTIDNDSDVAGSGVNSGSNPYVVSGSGNGIGGSGSGIETVTGTGGSTTSNIGGAISKPASPISKPSSTTGMRRRETIHVKLIWGVDAEGTDSSLWVTNKQKKATNFEHDRALLDLAEPSTQEWLLEVVKMAKSKPELFVRQDKVTWIERLRDFAAYAGVEFPIPKHLFTTYVELLKLQDEESREMIEEGIGTSAPGLAGDFTYASITMRVDSVEVANTAEAAGRMMSEDLYRVWTDFATETNGLSPSGIPRVVAQSAIFLDAYRVEAMYNSTIFTWFVANGLCLLVIVIFIQNLALSFMVMVTITLILLCLGGFLFAVYRIPFGPVEALGVSIFIGLSANYSLHVVHAYHHSRRNNRGEKIKEAIFAVGSPIIASALSTMGASAFLFGCRTWVFIELGILICSITGMALLYTMTFLFSWLSIAGPLPVNEDSRDLSHRWDLKVMCWDTCRGDKKMIPDQRADDDKSVFSIEVVEELKGSLVSGKMDATDLDAEAKDDDSDYSIEIIEDGDGDIQESEKEVEEPTVAIEKKNSQETGRVN